MGKNKLIRYFDLAKKVSKLSTHRKFKIGAVLVRKNRILAIATNSVKTHTKSPDFYKSKHAEFSTILKAGIENVQGCTLFTYRETKKGDLAIAKPCKDCEEFIKFAGIKRVIYSTAHGFEHYNLR